MWRVNKGSGPMILVCRHREVLITCVALIVGGCCSDREHLHISMLDSMEVLEYGKTYVNGVTDRTDMPIRYKLEREHYSLYSIIHQRSIPAQAIFYVEGKDLIDANIRGHDTSGHRGSNPQAAVDPAKIVVCEMQRRSGFEVVQFLAETIAQASQPSH